MYYFRTIFFVIVSILTLIGREIVATEDDTQVYLQNICKTGDLNTGYSLLKQLPEDQQDARVDHALSALEFILFSNVAECVRLHRQGKAKSPTTVPPLAGFYLNGEKCGGLGDLFYVSAVLIKQVAADMENLDASTLKTDQFIEALQTLITLTSDSGLPQAAEYQLQHALQLAPQDAALLIRSVLMTPGMFMSLKHIQETRQLLQSRLNHLVTATGNGSIVLKKLDEFVISPTFYYIYQGFNDRKFLEQLYQSYAQSHPHISATLAPYSYQPLYQESKKKPKKFLKIGFVSSYFRRHSVCKLFCPFLLSLLSWNTKNANSTTPSTKPFSNQKIKVYLFSSLQETKEDEVTRSLKHPKQKHWKFMTIGSTLIANRKMVLDQEIDILVYLDLGMEPATMMWAAARLAPVQMLLWGHPSTAGVPNTIDYFLSSDAFHRYTPQWIYELPSLDDSNTTNNLLRVPIHQAQDFFSEQLIRFTSLSYAFERPLLQILIDFISNHQGRTYEELLIGNEEEEILHFLNQQATVTKHTSLKQLIEEKLSVPKANPSASIQYVLCPQYAPKLHPDFDSVLIDILISNLNNSLSHSFEFQENKKVKIIFLSTANKRVTWQTMFLQRLEMRLIERIQSFAWQSSLVITVEEIELFVKRLLNDHLVFLEALDPQQYLLLLYVGEVMLDPFPFGGGVTALEALAVCTPVITYPTAQSVPQLASGMLSSSQLDEYIVHSQQEYVSKIFHILDENRDASSARRRAICRQVNASPLLYAEKSKDIVAREYYDFFQRIARLHDL
jgi:predicted O-linked N-acetylglucosamine transferase (SPINDLY family)